VHIYHLHFLLFETKARVFTKRQTIIPISWSQLDLVDRLLEIKTMKWTKPKKEKY
jgi:hypothetical protein